MISRALTLILLVSMFTAVSTAFSLGTDSLTDSLEEASSELSPVQQISASGIIIHPKDVLNDRISEIRAQIPVDTPGDAYFLLTTEGTYLVFADRSLELGEYEISGTQFPSVTIEEREYATVVANQAVSQEPTTVAVDELASNLDAYRYREVRVTGTLREASVAVDQQTRLTSPISFGAVTTDETVDADLVGDVREKAEQLARSPDWPTFQQVFALDETQLPVIDLEERYWTDSAAVTTGIVLAPDDVLNVKEAMNERGKRLVRSLEKSGALYVTGIDYNPESVQVGEIHRRVGLGDSVRFTGYGVMERISIQQVLASAGVTVPVDATLQAGLVWNPADIREHVLVVGVTSERMGEKEATAGGKYVVTGKAVSARTLDASFPSGRKVVAIQDVEKEFEISNSLSDNPEITGKKQVVEDVLQGEQVAYRKIGEQTVTSSTQEDQDDTVTSDEQTSDSQTEDTLHTDDSEDDQSKDTAGRDQEKDTPQDSESRTEPSSTIISRVVETLRNFLFF